MISRLFSYFFDCFEFRTTVDDKFRPFCFPIPSSLFFQSLRPVLHTLNYLYDKNTTFLKSSEATTEKAVVASVYFIFNFLLW